MATGLGKTWLAAFDAARPQFRRVLFVAHREEILRQSLEVFRRVQPDADLGLFYGGEKQPEARVLFAGVQVLAANLHRFAPGRFDYVVVDEFHHAFQRDLAVSWPDGFSNSGESDRVAAADGAATEHRGVHADVHRIVLGSRPEDS
jgi:superfamily II DNA or RNA helicase